MKERLIGAAVLVAVAVWLIPWILDGSARRDEGETEALQLPAPTESAPLRSQTIRLDQSEDSGEIVPVPARSQSVTARGPESASQTAARIHAGEPQHGDADPAGAAAASPDTSRVATERTASAASAAHETPGPSDATASRTTANQTSAGDPAAAEPPTSGRVAPEAFSERTPTATAATVSRTSAASSAASAASSGGWMVQLGSFGERENAQRLVQRIATYGYKPDISTFRTNGRVMYRVRIGPHASRPEAEAAASSLGAHGFVVQVVAAD